MLLPRGLPWPGTPRLKEPMSRKKRARNCAATGLLMNVPVRSVKISEAAGGGVKSLKLTVQLSPPWQVAQPALINRDRPAAMFEGEGALGRPGTGELGVRTALRTHSRKAVKAGTLLTLPGRVTESWARPALGKAKALTALGATLRDRKSVV